ncbi:MAG: HAMP domain-containing sensor histidine kinase [Microthrixaceae bacterium]
MTLRAKLVLALVALSTAVAAVVGAFSYRTTANELSTQVDSSLRTTAQQLVGGPLPGVGLPRSERQNVPRSLRNFRSAGDVTLQVIGPRGALISPTGQELPVSPNDRRIATAAPVMQSFRSVQIDNVEHRLLTVGLGDGRGAVQVARSLAETNQVLGALRTRIFTAALVAAIASAIIGWALARQMTERLTRLTGAAESVASTRDPAVQIQVSGTDETARLGLAFNDMLLALSRAREDQQRLVQNASHELRTPLTSLRTNVFALSHADNIGVDQRQRILNDLTSETEELTSLINELIELATDRRNDEPTTAVGLGEVIEQIAARASQRSGREIRVSADGSVAEVRRSSIVRAIGNLLENAVKFDQSGGPIDISCAAGRIEVADRGPGLTPEDLDHVFERFYRAEDSRSLPGSGLGLAIVADIVSQHDGTVFAQNRPGGGTIIGFKLQLTEDQLH